MSPAVSSSGSDVPSGLRRRTVVAGAAWAVPVIAIGAPAAAAAASTTPTGDICTLTYYDGNDDYQKLDISLAATVDGGVIPAGTVLYWRFKLNKENTTKPVLTVSSQWKAPVWVEETPMNWVVKIEAATDVTQVGGCDIYASWKSDSKDADGYLVGGSMLSIYFYATDTPGPDSQYYKLLDMTVAERRTDMKTDDPDLDRYVSSHVYHTSSNIGRRWPVIRWTTDGVVAPYTDMSKWQNATTTAGRKHDILPQQFDGTYAVTVL